MALQNFIQTLWDTNLMVALRKAHVFASVANTEHQGEFKNMGDSVRVMQVNDPTITAYTTAATVTPENVDDAAMVLTADQAYYFAFKVHDVEAAQAKPSVLAALTQAAAYGFANTVDAYFAGLYAQAGLTSYSTGTTNWDVTSLNVEDVLLAAGEKMDGANAPRAGRFLVIPPWFHTKLILAQLTTKTQNDALAANGLIQNVLGFDCMLSNNVSIGTAGTGANTRILGGVRGQSWSFADAINSVEAYRPEAGFDDAVKGLYVFGGKVMRPDQTICIYTDKTAEA
jgi:hypothetical protein